MKNYCPACQSSDFSQVIASERMYGLGGEFLYRECLRCKSLHLVQVPEDMSTFYPDNYYAFKPIKPDGFLIRWLKRARYYGSSLGLTWMDNEYLGWLKNLRTSPEESIADIGCGNGNLLWQLHTCGFRNMRGFDPFIEEEVHHNSLRIEKIPFLEIKGTFDVLMFHHSFEHFQDPLRAFSKIDELLKPGGRALIRLPVTDGLIWQQEREYWFQLDAPRHLFIPSVAAMKIMGEKAGLQLEKVVFDSLPNQFWGTEIYKRGQNFVDFDLENGFTKAEMNTFAAKAATLNQNGQGDQAAFFFKK